MEFKKKSALLRPLIRSTFSTLFELFTHRLKEPVKPQQQQQQRSRNESTQLYIAAAAAAAKHVLRHLYLSISHRHICIEP